jgi:hypothetical protein
MRVMRAMFLPLFAREMEKDVKYRGRLEQHPHDPHDPHGPTAGDHESSTYA